MIKKKLVGVGVSGKGILEEHVKKVGFPIDTKGKSEFSLHGAIDKIDIGKVKLKRPSSDNAISDDEKSIESGEYLDLGSHNKNVKAVKRTNVSSVPLSSMKKTNVSPVLGVSTFPEIDDDSSDSQDDYIPDVYVNEEEEEEEEEEEKEEEKEDNGKSYMFKQFEEIDEKTEKKKSLKDKSLMRICVRPMSAIETCIVDRSMKLGVIERKKNNKPGGDWVHDLVEEFSNPERIPELERTLETDFHCLSAQYEESGIKNPEKKKKFRKESEEECDVYQEDQEREQEAYDKMKRIMELEKISGNKYLNLEPEKNKKSTDKELARKSERFTIWINSVIDEQNKIRQSLDQSYLPLEFIEQLKATFVNKSGIPVGGEKYEESKEHNAWINRMIKEIIMIDQVHDLEKVIKSMRGSMPQEEGLSCESDETLGTFLAEATGSNVMAKMDGIKNLLTVEEGDVDDDIGNSSEEDNKEEEEWLYALPPESEAVLQEITKTEKELTKDCHDLKSYVQKCRDNTKLYSLYRGDTPKEWKFLSREPGESRNLFKYRALFHAMKTMGELQEGFISDMVELQKQDIDLTEFMSDGDLLEPVPCNFEGEEYVVPEENEFYDSMEDEKEDI